MRAAALIGLFVTLAVCVVGWAGADSTTSLRTRIRDEVRRVERAKTTVRFFDAHLELFSSPDVRVRHKALRDHAAARRTITLGRLRLTRWRAQLARARRAEIPHLREWLCIHAGEGAWDANTGNGYYGGLQMDLEFQRTYAPWLLRSKGTADHWSPREQMLTAERAWRTRGFWPWPNTARRCGLLP